MPKYKVGDVLKSKNNQLEIEGVIGRVYIAVGSNGSGLCYSEKELEDCGYTLAQPARCTVICLDCHKTGDAYFGEKHDCKPARWVPSYDDSYYYVDSFGDIDFSSWREAKSHYFRLSVGNIFKTCEEAEAYKRRWQEWGGNK
jgi:hypothetical protein